MPKRSDKQCEGCGQERMSRFRTAVSRYLCPMCWDKCQLTGQVPTPKTVVQDDDSEDDYHEERF